MAFRQYVDDRPSGSPPMIGKRLTEDEWLGYLENYDFGPVAPDRAVLHHTWSPNEKTWKGLPTMKGMQNHYRGLGWKAAPHIYTAPDGIWLFTPMNMVGIHANSGNAGYWYGRLSWYSIGVEAVGFFDHLRPGGRVWELTRLVLGSLCYRFKRPPEQAIGFHRDFTNTKSCPGWAVTKPWVHSEVAAWMRGEYQIGTPHTWQVAVTAAAGLRVRQGRSVTFPVAATLRAGEIVTVDDDTAGWLHLADHRGFISKEWTRPA